MDAKERLRRYLEQRREVGESELVLDGLPVEDVLAMLGAKAGSASRPAAGHAPSRAHSPSHAGPPPPAEVRETVVAPPPEPEVRFDASVSTDWRETLRAAGAGGGDGRLAKPAEVAPGENAGVPPVAPADAAADITTAAEPARSSDATPPRASSAPLPAWLAALGLPAGLSVGVAGTVREDRAANLPSLDAVADAARTCTSCALHASAKNVVPGEGNSEAEFLCVGEAPGANEDLQGRPFVGEAGQLLTKILGAIQLQREDVYICNVLKHRPPGNRDPLPDEVAACQPFLMQQLALVRPRVILALGRFAAQTLLQTTTPIGKLRGQLHSFHGTPLIVTYHPAALLRNEAWKRPTWEDVKLARRILDASRADSGA